MYLLLIILSAWPCALWEIIHTDFDQSNLVGKNDSFWKPEISRDKKKFFGLIRLDAETLMPIATIFILISATILAQLHLFQIGFIGKGWQLLIACIVFIMAYNIIWRRYMKK